MDAPKPNFTDRGTIKEGLAEVLPPQGDDVFYNPVQVYNRDLSIMVLRQFVSMYTQESKQKRYVRRRKRAIDDAMAQVADGDGQDQKEESADVGVCADPSACPITILEALSATGLRAIRYAKEIPGIGDGDYIL